MKKELIISSLLFFLIAVSFQLISALMPDPGTHCCISIEQQKQGLEIMVSEKCLNGTIVELQNCDQILKDWKKAERQWRYKQGFFGNIFNWFGNLFKKTTCTYDGKEYKKGETFPASDGCNTCWCDKNGGTPCTEIKCPGDTGDKLEICPDGWIDNQMPCACPLENRDCQECKETEYFILNRERRELSEFNIGWVNNNCNITKEVVY